MERASCKAFGGFCARTYFCRWREIVPWRFSAAIDGYVAVPFGFQILLYRNVNAVTISYKKFCTQSNMFIKYSFNLIRQYRN